MKVKLDRAYWDFLVVPQEDLWKGTRIKQIRDRPLHPGGRVRLTLFEAVGDGDRPHPRMQVSLPPATDPRPPGALFAPSGPPSDGDQLRRIIADALKEHQTVLTAADLDPDAAPAGSPRYWRNSIRVQRVAGFFAEVRARLASWLDSGDVPRDKHDDMHYVVHATEAETYATRIDFDDDDTGTYHSYGKDEPFVHYLEVMLASLPDEGGEDHTVLSGEAQHSVRRQRDQLRAHLDYLMRHKYAYQGIQETDIERTLGGLLIDRESRHIVSEVPDANSLVPRFELLRIEPGISHPHAGAWVYRDRLGGIHLQDGSPVRVDERHLRSSPRQPGQLTFRRASGDRRLRRGLRFDWDSSGWAKDGELDWVSWAGHCDIKAIMEQLGIALADQPELTEYRSDSDVSVTYDRKLLIEMIASVMELGSVYRRADGTGVLQRGIHHFGGSRNDARPDRLQFKGYGQGRHFRWPLGGRQDEFRITSLAWPDGDGLERADMGTVYCRNLPDGDAIDFAPNPRYIKTVEGDYNLINVSGALITAEVMVDEFDRKTGYPTQRKVETTIDLRASPGEQRCLLGTHIDDIAERRLFKVYLDRESNQIVGDFYIYKKQGGEWKPVHLPEDRVELPLVTPIGCTLSHEMKRDSPDLYQTLLDIALRRGQNICADTDKESAVWNGVVTRLDVKKTGENRERRTERWHVDLRARFGRATLDYLVRRDATGRSIDYCPTPPDDHGDSWPDFLWQDFPDIGSKGKQGRDWIVNQTMLERGLVTARSEPSVQGGFYVYDDHIKNVFEIIFAALAGYRHSVVHENKRYGFDSEDAWREAIDLLRDRRGKLTILDG